jgi:hypothetical protein
MIANTQMIGTHGMLMADLGSSQSWMEFLVAFLFRVLLHGGLVVLVVVPFVGFVVLVFLFIVVVLVVGPFVGFVVLVLLFICVVVLLVEPFVGFVALVLFLVIGVVVLLLAGFVAFYAFVV